MKEKLQKVSYIAPAVRVMHAAVEEGFTLSGTPVDPGVPDDPTNPTSTGTTLLGSGSWD